MSPDFPPPFEVEPPSQQWQPPAETQPSQEPVKQEPVKQEPVKQEPVKQEPVEEQTKYEPQPKGGCLRWIVLLIVLVFISYGVWYLFLKEKSNPEPQDETTVNVLPPKDPNLIGAEGGEITHPSGAKIIIPAGALDHEERIEIEKVAEGRVTDEYHLKPDDLEFLKPVKVTIPYKEENLYDWETPYDIVLWLGKGQYSLTDKKRTSVLFAQRKVSTELNAF